MGVRKMHFEVKQKVNKIDSQKYRNLTVPEIDLKLNEAQMLLVRSIAMPKIPQYVGLESSQRSIEDLRQLVVDQSIGNDSCLLTTKFDETSFLVELPDNYLTYMSSKVYATKGTCSKVALNTTVIKRGYRYQDSPFHRPSFEWRECNISFLEDKIKIHTDSTFNVDALCLSYIRYPKLIHNAQDAQGGTYKDFNGNTLTGFQDSELTNLEIDIVDLAVLLITSDLQNPDYQVKQNKIILNN